MTERVDVSVIIATFGSEDWRLRGAGVADNISRTQIVQPREIIAHHSTDLATARNEAAELSHSKWLCFVDADDALHPMFFSHMSRHLHRTGILLNPSIQFILPEGPQNPRCFRPRPLREGNYLVISTMMSRDVFMRAGGFDPRWWAYEDWPLLWRCATLCNNQIVRVAHAIYQAYWRSDSRNNTVERKDELCELIRKDYDDWAAARV